MALNNSESKNILDTPGSSNSEGDDIDDYDEELENYDYSSLAPSNDPLNSHLPTDSEGVELVGSESVNELRERLERMKKMMAERNKLKPNKSRGKKTCAAFIDGTFLSVVFSVTLAGILGVSVYAFYNLFYAIYTRNARPREEL